MKSQWRWAVNLAYASLGLLSVMLMAVGAYVLNVGAQAPPPSAIAPALRTATAPEPSVILSADGVELAHAQLDRREPLVLAEVSPHVIDALLATEDHRFHEHGGIDWLRSAQAAVRTCTGRLEGGSTITQQLARNLFPEQIGRERSLRRKVKEIVTARRIEQLYSKDQILQAYLNTVPFLYKSVGIGAAARTYFNKPASELNVLESATLVGMLKGTQYFNPVLNPERARERRNLVLAQMVRRHTLSRAEFNALKVQPLHLDFKQPAPPDDPAPHFTAHVRKWLDEWAQAKGYDFQRDGLIVHTTLNMRMQEAAEAAVRQQTQALQQVADVEWSRPELARSSRKLADYSHPAKRQAPPFAYFWQTHGALLDEALRKTPQYHAKRQAGHDDTAAMASLRADTKLVTQVQADKTRLEAGFIAIDPGSGAIKAWVGSRDHKTDQFDHVAQAVRQPGSTFKPIVYASALARGFSPFKTYMDMAVEVPLSGGAVWRPTDMAGASNLPMTMREGLIYSKNSITTQVMQDTGLDNVADMARAMGITRSKLDKVPSMALGTSPVTLLEMASVYATIADDGRYRAPYFIDHITDRNGFVVAQFGPARPLQAMPLESDHTLLDMMRSVVQEGTGSLLRARFVPEGDVAGKTGTTQRNTDAWFMAIHPQVVVGAWVGFNDQRVAMRGPYWGQGGHSALLLVGDFLSRGIRQQWVDAKAAFAVPRLSQPVALRPDWGEMFDPTAAGDTGEGRLIGPDDITIDPAGPAASHRRFPWSADEDDAPKTAEELGEAMRAMGRDPETGAPVYQPAAPSP